MTTEQILATKIIEASEYTIAEIKGEYKKKQSESFRRGWFAARGFNWLQGQIIEQSFQLNSK